MYRLPTAAAACGPALCALLALCPTADASEDPPDGRGDPWAVDLDTGLELEHTAMGLGPRWPDGQAVVGRSDTTAVRGDLRLGAHRPGFAAYGALSGAADLAGGPDLRAFEFDPARDAALHRRQVHAFGGVFGFVHQAWAELDGFGDGPLARRLSLRAGRQAHWGPRPVTFDGAKLGLDARALTAQLYGGRRSAVYGRLQDDPGLIGGVRLLVDLERELDLPLNLRAEYQIFQRTLDLDPLDALRFDAGFTPDVIEQRLGLGELAAAVDVGRDLLLDARLDLLDLAPSHVRVGARWALGPSLLTVDLDHKLGEDAPYDLAAGRSHTAFDPRTRQTRQTTFEALRLNLPDRADYTDIAARLTVEPVSGWAIEPHARLHAVHAGEVVAGPYDAGRIEFGLAASGALRLSPKTGLELEATYDGALYDRSAVGPLPLFDDVAAGPEADRHAVGLGARFVAVDTPTRGRRLLTERWLTAGVWATWARYGFGSRYLSGEAEDMLALRTEATVRLDDHWTVGGRYEFARDGTSTFAHLGDVHLARVRVGLRW